MKYTHTPDFDYSRLDSLSELERLRCLMLLHSPEQFRDLQSEQLLSQMGFGETRNNPYENDDYKDVVKHCLIRSGQSYKETDTRSQLFARALGTSDLRNLLVDVTNKTLAKGWDQASTTYQDWAFPTTTKDFKPSSLVSLPSFSKITKVNEGQEIEQNTLITDELTTFKLETFGKIFSVSRRAYINDDFEVLKSTQLLMGSAARQAVEESVWTVLLSNPTLTDSIALYHGDHSNLISGALNSANLDVARAALGTQMSNGSILNLPATHLLVPKALEGTARTLVNAQHPDGSMKVIASAHLDLVSASAWYLVSNVRPPITVATLVGRPVPEVLMKSNLITDNLDYKVIFDFAVIASEFRSIVKSTGA